MVVWVVTAFRNDFFYSNFYACHSTNLLMKKLNVPCKKNMPLLADIFAESLKNEPVIFFIYLFLAQLMNIDNLP